MDDQTLSRLVAMQKPGYALPRVFYQDDELYAHELDRIFMRSWIYAGHESEIPEPGDYLRVDFADESVVVVRNGSGGLSALINVCRHRGSRVCLEARGHASKLVCPYHGWTYDLSGDLRGAAQMPEGFDKAQLGLKKAQVRSFCGMMFINLAAQPVSFDVIEEDLTESLKPYGLEKARVAHRQTYPIAANWKLAEENYSECYHCAPAHPEYSRGHGLALPDDQYADALKQVMARATACGLSDRELNYSRLDSGEVGNDRSYERYPLLRGHVTGSRDGKPLAPLLGDIRDYDGGATDFQIGPVTHALAYCDHIVIYRFTPRSVSACECDISWLVNGDAEEGRDYKVDELTWLWDITTQADQKIIEHNQEGVNSRFYEPGPYSSMEDCTVRFVNWYLAAIQQPAVS